MGSRGTKYGLTATSSAGGMIQDWALTLGGCMWSLMVHMHLDSLGFLVGSVVPQVGDPLYQLVH